MKKKLNKHVLKPLKHGNNMVQTLSKHCKPCLIGYKTSKYWQHERKNCKNLLYKVEKGTCEKHENGT